MHSGVNRVTVRLRVEVGDRVRVRVRDRVRVRVRVSDMFDRCAMYSQSGGATHLHTHKHTHTSFHQGIKTHRLNAFTRDQNTSSKPLCCRAFKPDFQNSQPLCSCFSHRLKCGGCGGKADIRTTRTTRTTAFHTRGLRG